MKALVRYSPLPKKIKIKEIANPILGKKEKNHAIIKVLFCGICGRDIEHYKQKISKKKIPSVLGHEFSGVIHKINKNNLNLKLKDRVACETVKSVCEKCEMCKNGFYNLCKKRKNIGGSNSGAFSPLIKVPIKYIHKISKKISFEAAALIEPMAVCYNALIINSKIKKNNKILIFGAGTIGLLCLKIAVFKKAKVILICTKNDKLQVKIAKKNRVKKIFFNDQNYLKKVLRYTKNLGVDLVVDTVGGSDETFQKSLELVKPGGQITKVGWFMKNNIHAKFDQIVRKNIIIKGSFSHNYSIWEKCIFLLKKNKINIEDLIFKKKFNIENWKEAFNLVIKRKAVKILMYSNE